MHVFSKSCLNCGRDLRLVLIEPHLWKDEYETQVYSCDRCGETKAIIELIRCEQAACVENGESLAGL